VDLSWDALFESAGQLVPDGWTAELAIPFKSVRFPSRARGETARWGFQILREIKSKDERAVWAPVSRDVMGFLTQMGVLEGASPSIGRNLEIMPTFTAIRAGSLDATSGRFNTSATRPEGGLNVKYGVTPSLTFDVALNPDFSQIESDRPQIEVNQRFPLFFPELRPFFTEGQEIFDVGGPVNLVHTRTIVDPRWGAKLTGKIGRTALGILVADDEAPGRRDDPHDPVFGKSAQVAVGRVRHDLYANSYIGAIVTSREFVDGYSRTAAADGNLRMGRNHRFEFRLIGSNHRDEQGVERGGRVIDLGFFRQGRHLSYSVGHFEIDPAFRSDTGFVRRVDMKQTSTDVSYRWWPEHWVISWGPRVRYARNVDFAGVLQDEQFGGDLSFRFGKNVTFGAGIDRDMERFGDIPFRKSRYSWSGSIATSRRVSLGGFVSTGDQVYYGQQPFLGTGTEVSLSVLLRPFSRLQSDLQVTTSNLTDPRTGAEVVDVKILRGLTTYQFTDRFLVRNITEYIPCDGKLALNVLFTYRVNSGTVFFAGYDELYRGQGQGHGHGEEHGTGLAQFLTTEYRRTNRAIFVKLQYLFRR